MDPREIARELAKSGIKMPHKSIFHFIYDNAETFAGKIIYGQTYSPIDPSNRQDLENQQIGRDAD